MRRCAARRARSRNTRSTTSTTTSSASRSACASTAAHVHWASTPAEARAIVVDICRAAGAKRVTKGKSMVGEEIALNEALEAAGFEPIETDLGEYIIQLAGEPPSHIIAPAIHKTKDQIADLFHAHHAKYGFTERQTEPTALVGEARAVLREKFQSADVWDHRRELPRGGDRVERHRHQRGQRRSHQHAAPRAHRDHGDREGGADPRRHEHHPARAGAKRHRAGVGGLHDSSPAARAAPAISTGPASTTSCCSTTAARRCSATSSTRCCGASAAARA